MFQNSLVNNDCDCNDYSLLTANTGIKTIRVADPKLSSPNRAQLIITASGNGTLIKSIIIKAVNPVLPGMVRLYIYSAGHGYKLYKEVPISTYPVSAITPIPYPVLTTYEITLVADLKLEAGDRLYASTQNAQVFNIIAEGLNWAYPESTDACCNFLQESANTGITVISAPNPNTDGSGTIYPVFTASTIAYGSLVIAFTIKALQSTQEGVVRLFISPDGKTWSLMREFWIPQSTQSAYEPSFKQVINMNFNLEAGYIIGVSTQNAESFAITAEGIDWMYPTDATIISRTITIDHTQCGSSDSTNFPVLVSLSDSTLKTIANGGHVANANGYDIQFFSDSGETSLLNWEVELYDGSTGTLIVWVNIPTVSHTTNTVFYMQYGNASIMTFQGGAVGSAWNGDYEGVYHFPNGTTLSTSDSTSNGYDGTNNNAVAIGGMIDGAASFDGSTSYVTLNAQLFNGLTAGTFEGWFYPSSLPAGETALCYENGGGFNAFNIEFYGPSNPLRVNLGSNTFIDSSNSSWNINTWYHIVLTFDGTNVIFYINGALDSSYANSSVPGTSVNNTNFGSAFDPSYLDFYAGIMDEVRISNIARTTNWVLTEYNNQDDPGNIDSPGFLTIGSEY